MKPRDSKGCPGEMFSRGWQAPGGRPPRHWLFVKVILLFLFFLTIFLLLPPSGEEFTWRRFFTRTGWGFLSWGALFFVLRGMFRPMRWLLKGVHEISEGNLDFQFPSRSHGEFRYLFENFNLMARRVKEMVQSKEQLLLDVSHELRSPLTRLRVALEMAPKGKWRDSMRLDVAEMESMIAEILETERLRSGNGKLSMAPVDLTALARETVEHFKEDRAGVELVGEPVSLVVMADEFRVKTVLRNVVENALKYSAHAEKPVQITLASSGNDVLITVQDFGAGIPKEELSKVFEPFYRVDKSRNKETGGYGLGLSLCLEIMKAHGGEIHLESEPGQGTKVSLRFKRGTAS